MIQIATSKSAIEGVNHNLDVNLQEDEVDTTTEKSLALDFWGRPPYPPLTGITG